MAISIGDAVLKITGDTKGLDRSLNDANRNVSSMAQKMQKSLLPMGAAFTAIGAGGLAMLSSTKKINAQLGVTAINLGITTKEMRDMTLAITNVTFSIDEVTKTFDLLARAGVKDQEVMKSVATAFDTLGDAIGIPAGLVTAQLVPAMKTFNVSAEEMAAKTDSLTWLFRNTTVSIADFNRMVGYVTPDLVAMGLTTEDMIAILAELEEQGYAGEVMTREFRKAVTRARDEQISLNESLGISNETIEGYKEQLDGATGLTQEYADVANQQYTIMDKLKQKWSELTLRASGFLEPLEPILVGMTALGPLMMALSFVNIPRLIASLGRLRIATKLAAAAQWLLNAAMTANPIGLVVIAIAGLIGAIIALERKFGWLTKSTKTELEKQTEIWQTEINKQREIARSAHDERMSQLSEYWAAQIASLDEETKARLAPYLAEIGMLEEWAKDTEEAREETANLAEARELIRRAQAATTAKEIEALEEEIAAFKERIGEAGFNALIYLIQEEARVIQDAADTEKALMEKTAKAQEAALAKQLADLQQYITDAETLLQEYHDKQLARIEEAEKPRLTPWGPTLGIPKWLATLIPAIYKPPPAPIEEVPPEIKALREALASLGDSTESQTEGTDDLIEAIGDLAKQMENLSKTIASHPIIEVPELGGGALIKKPTLALLGERGPEVVTPLAGATGGLAQGNVTINISAGALMGNESEARKFARLIHRYLREETRTRAVGITV